jgi:hypothetical protein
MKTTEQKSFVGSNPTASAKIKHLIGAIPLGRLLSLNRITKILRGHWVLRESRQSKFNIP